MTNEMTGAKVIEVATNQLSVHSKQTELSPEMRDKDWTKFLAGIKENGILQPLSITKGNRVIDGKNRLKAAKLLGYENVRVVIEDVPEDEIATYITETKLSRDELTRGQRAAIVINLYYEEERAKAEEREARTRFGSDTGYPELDTPEERGATNEILAKKSGVGKSNIAYLLAVKRNRPDLFAKVFSGEYAIGRAHAVMKKDEAPEEVITETPAEELRKIVEKQIELDSTQPQYDDSEPEYTPRNKSVRLRKETLSMSAKVLDEVGTIDQTEGEIRKSTRSQLLSLAASCIITLGQTAKDQDEQDLLFMAMEVIKKIEGED